MSTARGPIFFRYRADAHSMSALHLPVCRCGEKRGRECMCVVSAFHLSKTATRRYLTFAYPPGERAADKDYEEHMAFKRPCSASVL